MKQKYCKLCNIIIEVRTNQKYCSDCRELRNLELYEKVKSYAKLYYHNHKEAVLQRMNRNKGATKIKRNIYRNNKRKTDISFKLRDKISTDIRQAIIKKGSVKNGSILNFLPYTIQELKEHLEKQFEPWMNWNNWGTYNKETWNNGDSITWTWQIDHIIPHSKFNYTSMKDQSFKDCWALNNLRPLSAKMNLFKRDKLEQL